ncbi:hypothetical protein [Paracoccus rhizosphaerae]|uniref:hypothetical protein n=1 Tax=Paracoccus rhizosphaerae TaxID=1133347 RepID=UPI00360AF7B0
MPTLRFRGVNHATQSDPSYDGTDVSDAQRLKAPQDENSRLGRSLAIATTAWC